LAPTDGHLLPAVKGLEELRRRLAIVDPLHQPVTRSTN
jgi:hypothetical protein